MKNNPTASGRKVEMCLQNDFGRTSHNLTHHSIAIFKLKIKFHFLLLFKLNYFKWKLEWLFFNLVFVYKKIVCLTNLLHYIPIHNLLQAKYYRINELCFSK